MVKVSIRCSNFGKERMIYVDILNITDQDIITAFVLNTMLHHVDMLWIVDNYEELGYDMDIQNSDWFTIGPWYNTYICKKVHRNLFWGFIINARTDRYNIMCSIHVY